MAKTKKKTKKVPVKSKRVFHAYTAENMVLALDAVKKGISVKKAAETYKVPRSSLQHKKQGRGPPPDVQRMGPTTTLREDEEQMLVNWLFHIADAGFPITKSQLLDNVQTLIEKLDRPNLFKSGRPGDKWFHLFLKRHQDVGLRIAQNINRARASVTEESLRNWFKLVRNYCTKQKCESVLEDPRRIFNIDETAFFLSPDPGKVLVKRNTRTAYSFRSNSDRECTTVLLGGNAAGTPTPPMIIVTLKRVVGANLEGIPSDWIVGLYILCLLIFKLKVHNY